MKATTIPHLRLATAAPAARLTPPLDQRTIGSDHLQIRSVINLVQSCPCPLSRAFFGTLFSGTHGSSQQPASSPSRRAAGKPAQLQRGGGLPAPSRPAGPAPSPRSL